MTVNFGVNWSAVIFAALVATVIGFAYYAPSARGDRWLAFLGITREQLNRPTSAGTAMGAVASVVNAWVLAVFSLNLGATGLGGGIVLGFLCWLGFTATITTAMVAFFRQPWGLWSLHNVHYLIVQIVMGAIVTVWR